MRPELSSRILRIGLINSGMFDLLTLNLDVQAVHFIAANNVGKTSLIELIQFLYFHDVRDMTFSKSTAESLAFYFRPEGSYILFEVRTLNGAIRTVGIYGEGTAATREIFVFDGTFDLDDFLSPERYPRHLKDAQRTLFPRRFSRYARFEDYERALIGEQEDARQNVQLFDLSITNFRLLRRLLQGLLRLDRLTSRDTQAFLIQIVETGPIKTRINIANQFERKYREIQGIQRQLDDLRQLAPTIQEWQERTERITEMESRLVLQQERLFHTSQRYLQWLNQNQTGIRLAYNTAGSNRERASKEEINLNVQLAENQKERASVHKTIQRWQELDRLCEYHTVLHVQQRLDELTRQRLDLEERLQVNQSQDVSNLHRRLKQRQQDESRIKRQMTQQTIVHLWSDAGFTETERALLKFLASARLAGLSIDMITDIEIFLALSRRAVQCIDTDGTFRGGGLVVPHAHWFIAETEEETLSEQLSRVQSEIGDLTAQLHIAEDQQKAKERLQAIQSEISQHQELLELFKERDVLGESLGSLEKYRTYLSAVSQQQEQINRSLREVQEQLAAHTRECERLYATEADLVRQIQVVSGQHQVLVVISTPCPPEIDQILPSDLAEAYRLSHDRVRRQQNDLRREQEEIQRPRQVLEARYDRESPEISFELWITQKLSISQEIARVEALLQENFNTLVTQVRGELSRLIQAYKAVENQVTELNNLIRRVSISNIQHISLELEESDLVKAIEQTTQIQPDLFSPRPQLDLAESERFVNDYLGQLRQYGQELRLEDMFQLVFRITFEHTKEPVREFEINKFESNGTRIAIKIVLYLGLIKLLQGRKQVVGARIPFFLDEVGSIESRNLQQLIAYCETNNFLPIFASPEIRPDIPHNYLFRRHGARSQLEKEMILTAIPGVHES